MKLSTFASGILLPALLSMFCAPPLWAQNLDETTFQKLHKKLQPSSDEAWRTIPWKISLLEAQKTAAKEQKPIFIWAMDGHPLGCT